jgi:hypothetical protein
MIVDNDVYKFRLYPKVDYLEVSVYTRPDAIPSTLDKEKVVKNRYFTEERLEGLKAELIRQISELPAKELFAILCVDLDGGYNITEEQIFEIQDDEKK